MGTNPVVHFEIGCRDGAATREFLSQLFDWEFSGPESASVIDTGQTPSLSGHLVELAEQWGNYQIFYVQVARLEDSLTRAVELGGKALVQPVELPGRGRFAWLATPEGNVIGLWEPAT